MITNYLHRAYKICNSWKDFHHEIHHIKQILINNNYANTVVDKHTKEFISKMINNETPTKNKTKIEVFYKNEMNGRWVN